MSKEKSICIYHANCADGFTSAWVVKKAIPNIELVAAFYGNPLPDVEGKDVYVVDFSYSREVMEELSKKAARVVHIDHHLSAIKSLEDFHDIEKFYSYDNKESGAMLCWKYFYPNLEPIDLVKVISDRDTWQFKIDGCAEASAEIFGYEYTIENWDALASTTLVDMVRPGEAILRRHSKDVKELVNLLTRKLVIDGHEVPALNIPYTYGSDACSILSKDAPFAVYYYDKPTHREFGLRSNKAYPGWLDVSEIAKKYGGGGHANAAGFKTSFKDAVKFEIS